jgi:predicted amidohydrolase
MRITILQRDIVRADVDANLSRTEKVFETLPKTDLVVMPEMFSTGFATRPEGVAEKDDKSLNWMKRMAVERGFAIAGSVAVEKEGRFYNRFYFVKPNGEVGSYDKHHLFTYGGEHKRFAAGDERVIVEWKGVRWLLMVCYDLRFPVWSRNKEDYDGILYVASWPTPRIDAWSALLKARAIENQCYVAGVNRVGLDKSLHYCGASVILDPYGKELATCGINCEGAASADIDMVSLQEFRDNFPVLKDRD